MVQELSHRPSAVRTVYPQPRESAGSSLGPTVGSSRMEPYGADANTP